MTTARQPRAAILVSSRIPDGLPERIQQGKSPRNDMLALAERLNATVINPAGRSWGRLGRLARFPQLFRVAWAGFKRRREYDVIVTDLDHVGGILALLFKLTRTSKGHVVICHGKLSRSYGGKLVRWLRLYKHIDRFVCYGPVVARRLVEEVGVPAHQVQLVRHPADHRFWHPNGREPEMVVASAGMYNRDYVTLVEAVRGLNIQACLAAFSPWVNPDSKAPQTDLPDNVTFTRLPPNELRDLYARALFIAVPLFETTSQAGSLVIYEAMAMGKAVIVTRTTGEEGLALVREGQTGFYVEPGDVAAWREKINYLMDHPEEARRMGQAARQVVEQGLNLDRYLDEMAGIVHSLNGGGTNAMAA